MEELSPLKVLNNSAAETARNLSRPVMLVGFLAQANLGLGYLASRLRERGYRVQIVDFEQDPTRILEIAQSLNSVLIGFSLIFQFYIERFLSLIVSLRNSGITCHFTVGGHFPSLSYQHALEFIPQLDSVVRFEGEDTLLELVDLLSSAREWLGHLHVSGRRFPALRSRLAALTREFVAELYKSGLVGKILWKINCRADAVDSELFEEMRAGGRYFVYWASNRAPQRD